MLVLTSCSEILITSAGLSCCSCTFSTNRGPVFCISRMTFLFKVLDADMPAISFCCPFFWTTQLSQHQINQPFCISSGSQEVLLTLPPLACTFSTNRGPVFCISRMTFLFKVLYADMPAISFCRPFFWTTQLIQHQINQPFCISSGSQEVLLTLPPLACWSWPQAWQDWHAADNIMGTAHRRKPWPPAVLHQMLLT